MGYKLLGFIVWNGGKLYLRRRLNGTARKAALAALAGLLIGGAVIAQRQHQSS
jgi:hypothetical protein